MKRLLLVAFLALVAFSCAGQAIFYNTTPTLAWDAVPPELPGDTIAYEVYLWDMSGGDITVQPIGSLSYFGTTGALTLPLNFAYRAEWAVAVRTKLTDGGLNVAYSPLAYSTVAGDAGGAPFFYVPLSGLPLAPASLRDSGT